MDYQAIIIAVGTVIGAAVLTAVLTKNSMNPVVEVDTT